MSLRDLWLPDDSAPRNRWLGITAAVVWGLGILSISVVSSLSFVRPFHDTVMTIGLAAISGWAFLGTGWRVLGLFERRIGKCDPLEKTVLELAVGVGAVMGLFFLLGTVGGYQRWVGFVVLLGLALLPGDPRRLLRELVGRYGSLRTSEGRSLKVILLLVGVMTFLESLTPATSQDALVYHLAVPDLYVQEGGMVYVPGNFYASFPQNVEMLFTLGLLLRDAVLAKWYHWLLGVGGALAAAAVARRISGGKGGLAGAAIFATMPTVALVATWAYVDLGLIFFQLTAVVAFLNWWERRQSSWLVMSAVLCGLAAGCKYTGGGMGLILLTGILIGGSRRGHRFGESLWQGVIFSLVTGAVVLPWFVKNLVFTGNPLFPFLFGWFGGRDWDAYRAEVLSVYFSHFGGDHSLGGLLKLPWRLTFTAEFSSMENFDGIIGPVFFLGAPVVLLGVLRSHKMRLVLGVSLGLTCLWILTTRQMRFLIPALAVASALIGGGMPLVLRGGVLKASRWILLLALTLNTAVVLVHFASHNPLPVVFGMEDRHNFLTREIPGGDYPLFAYLNEKLPKDARVFLAASGNPGYLCQRDYYMDALFENYTLQRIIGVGETPEGILNEFRRRGFSHLLFRWELVFDEEGTKSGLSLEEQRRLANFINEYARLESSYGGTFLYRLATETGE